MGAGVTLVQSSPTTRSWLQSLRDRQGWPHFFEQSNPIDKWIGSH